jgi:hypothetical protein
MPRWVRFLSCSFTGLLLSLTGLLLVAYWWEGGAGFWRSLPDFATTPDFWHVVLLMGLCAAVTLLMARLAVHVYGFAGPVAGFLAGGAVALAYAAFLVSTHTGEWGGVGPGLHRAWPSGGLLAAAFGVAGAFTTWLWDRLD